MTTRYALGRQQGITEELVVALADYEHGPFTDREKVAMRYADQMYFDHHKVDDGLFDGPGEFQDLVRAEVGVELAGEFISLGKIIYVLGVPYGEHSCGTLAGESH